MATVRRFEDLEIWQNARKLCKQIFIQSKKSNFNNDFRFRNQIFSSSGSVMDNIAEGFERDGSNEFKQFIFVAQGSCGETRSQLYRAMAFEYLEEDDAEKLIEEYQL